MKLFLIDAYALIYRAYYALIHAPRTTTSGLNTSAIYGFCTMLEDVLRRENPTHAAVCFDPSGHNTFRHDAYPEYKATRQAQPEDITRSIPYIKRIIEAYRIPMCQIEGYEADDVIGTLASRADSEGFETYMMTPDKDYGQLVTDRIFMYKPRTRGGGYDICGPAEICERYHIERPAQMIDLLALEGDSADNIPGCPGVGEKTAARLIAEFGSVDRLLDSTDKLKGALQSKIRDNAEQIRFSKFLATICKEVPMGDITPASLIRREPDYAELRQIYTELEFKTLIARLPGQQAEPVAAEPSLFDTPSDSDTPSLFDIAGQSPASDVTVADTPEAIEALFDTLAATSHIAIAVAATGADAMTAHLEGIAICTGDTTYIPYNQSTAEALKKAMGGLTAADSTVIVSNSVKRDMIILERHDMPFAKRYGDTAVAHYLLQPEGRHTLTDMAAQMLNKRVGPFPGETTAIKLGADIAPAERPAMYGLMASLTHELYPLLLAAVEREGMSALLNDMELPLIRVLADMEREGARIDTAELAAMSERLTRRAGKIEQQIYDLAGERFNISSPMQVGEILFDKLKLDPKAKRTKRGAYSTTEEILEKLRPRHPIVDLILRLRALRKLLATYIDALPRLINPATGHIHTTYNQTVTATGRLSSTNPNLQNIPVRTDEGREIRRAFIADEGCLFMAADYSQIELRLMACLSGDPDMVDAFNAGDDIHRATAAKIYHRTLDQVTDTERRNAKTANFGIIYGISAFGLSERLGIPRAEAKALIDGYFATYPHIRQYIDECIDVARRQGYVTTVTGRRRYLPDINSRNAVVRGFAERNAVNAPLQGSAADIIKRAMIDIHRHIKEARLRSRMTMQVHDELTFNVWPDELDTLRQIVVRDMTAAFDGAVTLTVSCNVGHNWLEAH